MSHAIRQGAAVPAGSGGPAPLTDRWRDARRALLQEIAGIWRYALARREFERLDERTLRDIGISRSEFASYWAEAHGLAEPTRVRVIRQLRERRRP